PFLKLLLKKMSAKLGAMMARKPYWSSAQGAEIPFEVNAFRKYCLLNGFDDIGLTLRQADKIRAFEAERLATKPWLAHTMPA
ncbi:hypothetical protein FE89_34160, partial [Azospirillum brasilense]